VNCLLCFKTSIRVVALLLLTVIYAGSQSRANFDELVNQASLARRQNDVVRAIELYSQALRLDPKWPNGWLYLGLLQYQTASYAEARDALTRFIGLTPQPEPALGLRGLCEFETGEYARSLEDISKSLSLGTAEQQRQEELLRFHQGMLFAKLGRFEEALRTYNFFAQKHISNPELPVAVGLAGLRMPLLPSEAREEKDLLELAGNATLDLLAGDQQQASRKFDELFRRFPDAPNEHSLYGFLLFISDPDAALTEFQHEVDLHPSNEQGQIMEAWALLMRRDPDGALPHALKAAETAPKLAAAQLVLGRSLVETGEVKNGIEHLRRGLQIEPKNLEIHIALAEAYSRIGNRQEAQRERQLCLQMTKDGANRIALP